MGNYGGEGPITALRNAGIGVLANTASSYLTQLLTQKRLENMAILANQIKTAENADPEAQQAIYSNIAKTHPGMLAKLPAVLGYASPGLESSVDTPNPLDHLLSTQLNPTAFQRLSGAVPITKGETIPGHNIFAVAAPELKQQIANQVAGTPGGALEALKSLKGMDMAQAIALLGLQLKQGGQAFGQADKNRKFSLDQDKFNLALRNLGLEIQKLTERVNRSKQTNKRLGDLEDIASRARLDKIVSDMNKYYMSGDIESVKRSMNQANSLIQRHPNLGIKPYNLEEPPTVGERLGINLPESINPRWGAKKLTGGETITAPAGKATMTPEQAQAELIKRGYTPDGKGGWVKK